MVSAVSLEGVSKTYDDFHAVRDVSFEVPAGRITGFLGPNGAGKTSTIRMILGLLPATAGKISVLGAHDAPSVRERIGFLPEERGLYKRMTPIDAIAFFAGLKGVPEAEGRKRAKAMLDEKRIPYEVIYLSDKVSMSSVRAATGASKVPQVFVGGKLIGGSDELRAWLEKQG